jgi:hypothetical protein
LWIESPQTPQHGAVRGDTESALYTIGRHFTVKGSHRQSFSSPIKLSDLHPDYLLSRLLKPSASPLSAGWAQKQSPKSSVIPVSGQEPKNHRTRQLERGAGF